MGSLGIDTSCYRTSVAYVDGGEYVQRRRLLEVPQGQKGLMQSELVFQHVRNLPELLEELIEPWMVIERVAVSSKPRPNENSYMPVFKVGEGFGRSIAAVNGATFIKTSHQQCHLRAAMHGFKPIGDRFLAMHLSGGTTETLLTDTALNVSLIGGTTDLNAGQLVDRVGVALGCTFPSGPALEEMAAEEEPKSLVKTSVSGGDCSFSGAEAQLMRMISAGMSPGVIAVETYSVISRTLAKLLDNASRETGVTQALLFGGVASSKLLRTMLQKRLDSRRIKLDISWAAPELSGDNAVGAAFIAQDTLI